MSQEIKEPQEFNKTIENFVQANKDVFSPEELELLQKPKHYQDYPQTLFQFMSSLYIAKLNERNARAMNRLTIALLVVAAVEAIATAVSAMIASGIIAT